MTSVWHSLVWTDAGTARLVSMATSAVPASRHVLDTPLIMLGKSEDNRPFPPPPNSTVPCYSYDHDQGYVRVTAANPNLITDPTNPTNPNSTDPTLLILTGTSSVLPISRYRWTFQLVDIFKIQFRSPIPAPAVCTKSLLVPTLNAHTKLCQPHITFHCKLI